ncbi:MAG: large subunit ribosomal protein [Gaiellales bacterium]|jgi:large subunit ribosomal protein L10|nr:large subunit ribosomal protein [Gaiellales bacterium]
MLKQRKEEIVGSLTAEFGGVSQMIIADPTGLTVAEMADLRDRLRPSGAEFRVAKNTLARIAARAAGREELVELLTGPTAITLVPGDPAVAAKTLSDFARTSRKLELRGAYLDGETLGPDSVRQLATLPSRDQLLTNLVSGMMSPISGLANVLAQLPRSLVVALDQVRIQKEAA